MKIDSLANLTKGKVDSLGTNNIQTSDSLNNIKVPNTGMKRDSLKIDTLKPKVDTLRQTAPPDTLPKSPPKKPKI
jgi:hypothetical protein